jgi:ribosomal protein S18 acetylase RimI-like enzyme
MITAVKITDISPNPVGFAVPGLAFRVFQGETDYPKMLAVIEACKEVDDLERADTLEDIQNTYNHLHNCDPQRDMILAEVNGEVVGYSRVWWEQEPDGKWIGFQVAFVHPGWRKRGIGSHILAFNEGRLAQIASELRRAGQLDNSVQYFSDVWTFESERAKTSLLEKAGYRPVRYEHHMVRSLLNPVEITSMPDGLEVRPVPPEAYRAVWDASMEAFKDHWGYIEPSEEDYQQMLSDKDFNPALWQVAWEGDQVAGMVMNFVLPLENEAYQRRRGYTEGICVRRLWRRRGLARALLTRSLRMFQEMGMTEAALSVDSQNLNGAFRLYESVGFRLVRRSYIERKELVIE